MEVAWFLCNAIPSRTPLGNACTDFWQVPRLEHWRVHHILMADFLHISQLVKSAHASGQYPKADLPWMYGEAPCTGSVATYSEAEHSMWNPLTGPCCCPSSRARRRHNWILHDATGRKAQFNRCMLRARRISTLSTGVAKPAVTCTMARASRQKRSDQIRRGTSFRQYYAQCPTCCGGFLSPTRRQPSQLGFAPKSHSSNSGQRSSRTNVTRRSTPVEAAQAGLLWRVARKFVFKKCGDSWGSFSGFRHLRPLVLPTMTQDVQQPSPVSQLCQYHKIKVAWIADQENKSEFGPATAVQQSYISILGAALVGEEEPTADQLEALTLSKAPLYSGAHRTWPADGEKIAGATCTMISKFA